MTSWTQLVSVLLSKLRPLQGVRPQEEPKLEEPKPKVLKLEELKPEEPKPEVLKLEVLTARTPTRTRTRELLLGTMIKAL